MSQQQFGAPPPARDDRDRFPEGVGVVYVGSSRGLETSLVRGLEVRAFFFPMAPPTSLRGMASLCLATVRSLLVIRCTCPDVTLATGGYVSVPAAIASWLLRVPLVLFLPDVAPGKAVKLLLPLARHIAASTEDALQHLPEGKTTVTGYPVREAFLGVTKLESRARFGLAERDIVLCVFGGSQGARSINEALANCLPDLLKRCHVLHICGEDRYQEAQAASANLQSVERQRYHLFPYLEEADMAAALSAADLALSRCGASILGELPLTGTPAVLVPLPDPAVHQFENANVLARHGAALILPNDHLAELGTLLAELLGDEKRLARMSAACKTLARLQAAQDIASILMAAAL